MRKITLFTLFLLQFVLVYGQEKYTIQGTLPDNTLDGSYIKFCRFTLPYEYSYPLIDSILVTNGSFYYEGTTTEDPFRASFSYPKTDIPKKRTEFIVDSGNIYIKIANWEEAGSISGTPINDDYNLYIEKKKLADQIIDPWRVKREVGYEKRTWTEDEEREYMNIFSSSEYKQADKEKMLFLEKYAQYPGVVRSMLFPYLTNETSQVQVQHILDKMPEAARDTLYALQAQLRQRMEEYRKNREPDTTRFTPIEVIPERLQIGQPYIDFTGRTPDRTEMKFSQILSGKKLILLDFWASWCAPCIKEIPTIAKIYQKYKDQGLVIIGITSDSNEDSWKRAIERHNMEWMQLISIDGKDDIGEQYNVKSIPYTLIIDGNGTIISRRLRGEKLIDEIDKLMGIE